VIPISNKDLQDWAVARERAFAAIRRERLRQVSKWGLQTHPLEWWLAILSEEVGEMAKAMLDVKFEQGASQAIETEAVQVAAVAAAIVQAIQTKKGV